MIRSSVGFHLIITLLTLSAVGCTTKDTGIGRRLVGQWQCHRRGPSPNGPWQTKWTAPCNVEYLFNGTYLYTEDGLKERGTFKVFENDSGLLEVVTESSVKDRIGRQTRSKINFLADQLTLVYEPAEDGSRRELVYVRSGGK